MTDNQFQVLGAFWFLSNFDESAVKLDETYQRRKGGDIVNIFHVWISVIAMGSLG